MPPLQRHQHSDAPPLIPDHKLIRVIGEGAYGQVWLAINAIGAHRAVKVVYRNRFKDERPYDREFSGIRSYEPLSRSNEGLVDILQVGQNDKDGYFYYVMELADDACQNRNQDNSSAHQSQLTRIDSPAEIPPSGSDAVKKPKKTDSLYPKRPPTFASNVLHTKTVSSSLEQAIDADCGSYTPRTLDLELRQRGRLSCAECVELGLSLSLALGHLHRHGLIHRDVKPSNIIFVNGIPKLADMGLVTDIGVANSYVGTEGFVPPEGPNSARADLYSLGKVLYECSMGKDRKEFPEPFTYIEQSAEMSALMELNTIILKACATTPDQRYASSEELHLDLALLHGGQSIRRKHLLEKRLRFAIKAGTAAAFLALLAFGGYLYQQDRAQEAKEQAGRETYLRELADAQAKRASLSERESRERLARLRVATGVQRMQEKDLLSALHWFVAALKADHGDPLREVMDRTRIATTLRHLPKLTQVWFSKASLAEAQFSPDGKKVMFLDEGDQVIRVCDPETGNPLLDPLRHSAPIHIALFSPDGKWIVAAGSDYSISLWNAETGQKSASDIRHFGKINWIRFSPDSRLFVTTGEDTTARLWTLPNADKAIVLNHPKTVSCADFTPDSKRLVTGCDDGIVRFWSCETGQESNPAASLEDYMEPIRTVRFSRDGKRMITVSGNRTVVWNTSTNRAVRMHSLLSGHWIHGADLSPDGGRILAWGRDSNARVWDTETGLQPMLPFKHPTGLLRAEFSHDGRRIVTVTGDHTLRLWNAADGEQESSPINHQSSVFSQSNQISPEGRRILTYNSGVNRLWDFANSPATAVISTYSGLKRAFFTRDGKRLVTVSTDNVLRVWDPLTGQENFNPHSNLESDLPIPFDSNWAPINPVLLSQASLHDTVVPSSDGSVEVVVQRNSAFVRDRKTRQPLTPPLEHREVITSVSFSPDNNRLATTSFDSTARVWDARTGEPITPYLQHPTSVFQASFSPNSRLLVTVSHAMPNVLVWDLSPDERPSDDLAALAELLTGATLDANGGLQRISDSAGTRVHWETLKAAYPFNFTVADKQKADWAFDNTTRSVSESTVVEVLSQLDAGTNPDIWMRRGKFWLSLNQMTHAITNFNRVVELQPDNVEAWFLRGLSYNRLGQLDKAVEDYSKSIALQPQGATTLLNRGAALLAMKQVQKGADDFDAALRILPASPGYWERRGRAFALMTNWPAALSDFGKARDLMAGISAFEKGERPLGSLVLPRPTATSPNQLDLSQYYNVTLAPLSPDSPWPSLNLTTITPGLVTYDSVPFDVRGGIQLSSYEMINRGGNFPIRVTGIPVQRRCQHLHFLHSSIFTDSPGSITGKYIVYYADGQRQEVDLVYGEHLSSSWKRSPKELKSAVVATSLDQDEESQTIFLMSWENPRPEVEIVMIDFLSLFNNAAPFLLGITVEP